MNLNLTINQILRSGPAVSPTTSTSTIQANGALPPDHILQIVLHDVRRSAVTSSLRFQEYLPMPIFQRILHHGYDDFSEFRASLIDRFPAHHWQYRIDIWNHEHRTLKFKEANFFDDPEATFVLDITTSLLHNPSIAAIVFPSAAMYLEHFDDEELLNWKPQHIEFYEIPF